MLLLCDERAAGALRSPSMFSRSSPLMPVRTSMVVGRSAQPLAGYLRVTGRCRAGAAGCGKAVLWPGLHGDQVLQCSLLLSFAPADYTGLPIIMQACTWGS